MRHIEKHSGEKRSSYGILDVVPQIQYVVIGGALELFLISPKGKESCLIYMLNHSILSQIVSV